MTKKRSFMMFSTLGKNKCRFAQSCHSFCSSGWDEKGQHREAEPHHKRFSTRFDTENHSLNAGFLQQLGECEGYHV
jgi:putative component of membrane protein insertase Oxa1/YidC/SpoIIIJ protein YidD